VLEAFLAAKHRHVCPGARRSCAAVRFDAEIELAIDWLFFVGGAARLISLLQARKLAGFWWALLGAVLAIAIVSSWPCGLWKGS
jgi:hypothetical protein